jgi:acyl carrier protein
VQENVINNNLMEIKTRTLKVISESIEVSIDLLNEDTAIGDHPSWDSMGQLIIISSLEKEFKIKFDTEDIMELEDIGDMIEVIQGYLTN